MNKKDVKLYNLIFPIWMFVLFPPFLLFTLPLNFFIDSVVLLISLKLLKIKDIASAYKKSIFKVFLFGYLADFTGTFIIMLIHDIEKYHDLLYPLSYEPASTPLTFAIMSVAIIIAGIVIYITNKKSSFNSLDITDKEKHKLALSLAIFTAPYTYMLSYDMIEKIFS